MALQLCSELEGDVPLVLPAAPHQSEQLSDLPPPLLIYIKLKLGTCRLLMICIMPQTQTVSECLACLLSGAVCLATIVVVV